MKIAVEPFSKALFEEILPLAQKSWEQSSEQKGERCAYYGQRKMNIDPNFDAYRNLAEAGILLVLTMREEGKLIGHAVGYVTKSSHHQSILCGYIDSVWIEHEHRGHWRAYVRAVEKEFAAQGAKVMAWPVTPETPLHKLLIARGFVGDDVIMEKLLCA